MKQLVLILFLAFSGVAAGAQTYEVTDNVSECFDLIQSTRFNEALKRIEAEKKQNPANLFAVYLESYVQLMKLMITEDAGTYAQAKRTYNQTQKLLESGPANSPWTNYALGRFYLHWSLARFRYNEYPSGGLEMNKAFRTVIKNYRAYPSFAPNHNTQAIVEIMLGSVPDNYKWVTRLLNYSGSVKKGMSLLHGTLANTGALKTYPFLKTEALFMLTFLSGNVADDRQNVGLLNAQLASAANSALVRSNPLLILSTSYYLTSQGKSGQALKLLEGRPQSAAYHPMPLLEYHTGNAKLYNLDPGARLHYLRFINQQKGSSNIKSAYQRLAWLQLINNDAAGYRSQMQRVLTEGKAVHEGDKQALKEAKSGKTPRTELLRARLLADGGYYGRANSELQGIAYSESDNLPDYLELNYRKGRIYDEWGKPDQAIPYYQTVLRKGEKEKSYYAANSALHLGKIYEDKGNTAQARAYYNKCLSLDYDEYKTGISHKAKAALNRLSK